MDLRSLIDKDWASYEKQRFLKGETKVGTDDFDPEAFKHDGFEDREKYLKTHAPALATDERLEAELNNFTPPRLDAINDSPYQALVIRYGILRQLIQRLGYTMEKEALLDAVQSWQQRIVDEFTEDAFSEPDDLLHLAKAAVDYGPDIDDSELHMIYSYFELHNESHDRKHEYYTWLDLFKRLSAIDRFPKISRSEKPVHAIDTIEKGLWSLQEQAIVYEICDPERGDLVGIPEEYADFIREWLYYEMSEENYLGMLEELEPFDDQSNLVEARETFGVESKTQGRNDKRRESLVKAGVFPSELLREVLEKEELKDVVDEYGLDAHRQKTDEMIEETIEYFEQSQKYGSSDEPGPELYLACYEEIADGQVDRIPPQLQDMVDEDDMANKLNILFEEATGVVFKETFNLENTELKGQRSGGVVADGEIEQGGKWLLWDNKRRVGEFSLGSGTQRAIKDYIDRKDQQHDVEWFVIIAPEFSNDAIDNANMLEMQIGVDIRLVRAEDFANLATYWREKFADDDEVLPLSVFYGSDLLEPELAQESIDIQFS